MSPTIYNPTNMICKYYCYLHKRVDGRIFYIGKGTYQRAINLTPSRRNKWHGSIVAKEGKENIVIELVPALNEEDAHRLEILNIAALKPYFELCNLTNGGEGISGYKHTLEHIISISGKNNSMYGKDLTGKNNPMYGKHHTLEAIKVLSDKNKGKYITLETREQMRINHWDNSGENNPCFNIPLKEEHKAKIRKNHIDQSGENAPWTNLTWKQVREIRKLYFENSLTQTEIARQFDMTASNIWCIIHNKSWKE